MHSQMMGRGKCAEGCDWIFDVESVGGVVRGDERDNRKGKRNRRKGGYELCSTYTSLPYVTDDLAVDDCEPSVFLLLHLSPCCSDLF
jgi:hypothetical protein